MIDSTYAPGGATATADARVLVCSVDRGLLGIHAGWVEAVYPVAAMALHATRTDAGQRQTFIVHRGEPALVVDLRRALDLDGVLGDATRDAYLVLRSGPLLLAVPVDHCVGIRTLDLGERPPVPCAVRRDGGLPLGHLVELDGRMLLVIDPARVLDGVLRDQLHSALRRARAICQRQHKLAALWDEIRCEPSAAALRAYASLCSRTGRARAAAAVRAVLAALPDAGGEPDAGPPLLRALLRLAGERRSGTLRCLGEDGAATLDLVDGRLAGIRAATEHGRAARARLLAAPGRARDFGAGAGGAGGGPLDSTAASAIAALETIGARRRRRAAH
ncbi:MAG: chemotaxis protein CheW [Candidatus Binatia bacterium]